MRLKLRLFAPIDAEVGKRDLVVDVKATALPEILRELARTVPGLEGHLMRDGQLTEHINIFVNGKGIFLEEMASQKVRDGDEVLLMPPITGG